MTIGKTLAGSAPDLLMAAGGLSIAVGLLLIAAPAGLIGAGVMLIVAGLARAYLEAKQKGGSR